MAARMLPAARRLASSARGCRHGCSTAARRSLARAASSPRPDISHSDTHLALLTAVTGALCVPGAAWADDMGVSYNAGSQSEFLTNLAGFAYVLLVIVFLYRVLTRRAKRFKEESLTGGGRGRAADKAEAAEEADPELREPVRVSPLNAAFSAAQACAIAAVLYYLSTSLDAAMVAKGLPDTYTARQITVTVRTIISGLAYLATFIFAANGLGLTALTVKLLVVGDDEPAAKPKPRKPKDTLPKVGLTSDLEDVMKAFDEVSSVERYRKSKGSDAKG